ncbi:dTDP-4-dehydrorhamnose 3,5-epimerase [Clostridium botulinum]|nr:dTDP-4-dehydrorhamnose 3,5-epimerase [Clostridium botulinum]
MNLIKTKLEGVYIVEPQIFQDERGWFVETYSKIKTPEIHCDFVQDNQSYSKEKGIIRGLHFQDGKYAQAKLVRCIKGAVLDVAVDLRKNSLTYKQWIAVEISAENKKQLFIPRGFAHGFLTLTKDVEFVYKADNYYNKENDRSIKFNDKEIGIEWGIDNPILSEKDKKAPLLKNCNFSF